MTTTRARRSRLALVAALLATAAGGAWWWRRAGPRAAAPPPPVDDGPTGRFRAPPAELSALARPATQDELAELERVAQGGFEAAVASGVVVVGEREPFEPVVHVVERASGRPVGGALVVAIDPARLWARRVHPIESVANDVALALRCGAIVRRADAGGTSSLPPLREPMLVLAERAGLRGAAFLGGDRDATIALAPPTELVAKVVGADGRARAGVRVAFAATGDHWSGADGRVAFRDLELFAAAWPNATGVAPPVALDVPIDLPPKRRVDLRLPREGPTLLALPACGAVVVRAVDETGAVVDVDGSGELSCRSLGADGDGRVDFALESGVARPVVGVPLDARGRVELAACGHAASAVDFDGPTEEGATITVDVALGAAHPVVRGRAIDDHGEACVDFSVEATLAPVASVGAPPNRSAASVSARLAADGRFLLDLEPLLPRQDDRASPPPLAVELALRPDRPLRSALRRIAAWPASRTVDLGDVLFAEAAIRARGVVVDERGRPVALAAVIGWCDEPGAPDGARSFATKCDLHGRFELRDLDEPRALRVRAFHPDFAAELVEAIARAARDDEATPVESATAELRLVAPGAGLIEGTLTAPPAPLATSIALVLRRSGASATRVLSGAELAPERPFRFGRLVPGRYEIDLVLSRDGAGGERVAHVQDIVVQPRERTRDPRLQPLDPWARLRWVEVTAQRADGTAIDGVEATTRFGPERVASSWSVDVVGAVAGVPTLQECVDLCVRVDGGAVAFVEAVRDRATVTVATAPRVRLVVDRAAAWLAEREVVELVVECADERLPAQWRTLRRVATRDLEWVVDLPAAGRFAPSLRLASAAASGDASSSTLALAPFEVEATGEERVIELEPRDRVEPPR